METRGAAVRCVGDVSVPNAASEEHEQSDCVDWDREFCAVAGAVEGVCAERGFLYDEESPGYGQLSRLCFWSADRHGRGRGGRD